MRVTQLLIYMVVLSMLFLPVILFTSSMFYNIGKDVEEEFKNYAIKHKDLVTNNGLWRLNISYTDLYSDHPVLRYYYVTIVYDINSCQPYYDFKLYYNNTVIAEYYESPNYGVSKVYIKNKALVKQFLNIVVSGE